jgi:hypothetical protein
VSPLEQAVEQREGVGESPLFPWGEFVGDRLGEPGGAAAAVIVQALASVFADRDQDLATVGRVRLAF